MVDERAALLPRPLKCGFPQPGVASRDRMRKIMAPAKKPAKTARTKIALKTKTPAAKRKTAKK
jgi:hypothetical protein